MSSSTLLILCTCPDRPQALEIATTLVREGLAACVNIGGPLTSVYRWEGQIERAEECLLLIKTPTARYEALEQRLRALHPYSLPEIIALPIERGLSAYLQWVEQCASVTL